MGLRKDALAAAAEMILAVERRAAGAFEPGLVATVGCDRGRAGRTQRHPRPGQLHARRPGAGRRATASRRSRTWSPPSRTLAGRRHVRVKVEKFYDEPAVDLRSRAWWPQLEAAVGASRHHAAPAAQRRRPRRPRHRRLVPDRHAVRALQGRDQPQPRRVDHDQGRRRRDPRPARLPAPLPRSRAMPDRRPLWLRDPLAILAEGDAAGGIVVAGGRIVELVPRRRAAERRRTPPSSTPRPTSCCRA